MSANIDAISQWLQVLWDRQGSDLLLATGSKPRVRVDGKLTALDDAPVLTGDQIDQIVRAMLTPQQEATLEENQDVDFSFSWLDRARLRGSAFTQKGETALALRMIPSDIPNFEELGLPPVAEWLARLPRGPGAPDRSDRLRKVHHPGLGHRSHQRDACGAHPDHRGPYRVRAQARPLRRHTARGRDRQPLLRACPPVGIARGPRRPPGGRDARPRVDSARPHPGGNRPPRVLHIAHQRLFPGDRPHHRRLPGLATGPDPGPARVVPGCRYRAAAHPAPGRRHGAAFEILIANHPVRNIIREGKTHQLPNLITTGQADGMCSLESSLADLVLAQIVDYEDALSISSHPKELSRLVGQRSPRFATA